MTFTAEDLPLLGETPSIELANTQYGEGDWACDFLEDETLPLWLSHVSNPTTPEALGSDGVASLRQLRDAVVDLFDAAVAGRPPASASLAVLDQHCGACTPSLHVVWEGDRPVLQTRWAGPQAFQYLAQLARDAVDVATGERWNAIRRCAAQDCTMLFLQQHRRRRFCDPSCSQRMRQTAYYRRKRRPS